jgi:hypothetical protein
VSKWVTYLLHGAPVLEKWKILAFEITIYKWLMRLFCSYPVIGCVDLCITWVHNSSNLWNLTGNHIQCEVYNSLVNLLLVSFILALYLTILCVYLFCCITWTQLLSSLLALYLFIYLLSNFTYEVYSLSLFCSSELFFLSKWNDTYKIVKWMWYTIMPASVI